MPSHETILWSSWFCWTSGLISVLTGHVGDLLVLKVIVIKPLSTEKKQCKFLSHVFSCPLKNVLNTFLCASVGELIQRVLFWLLYGEIERLRMGCRFLVPPPQRREKGLWLPGSMLLHMVVPRSAWPRGFLLPNWKSVFCSATSWRSPSQLCTSTHSRQGNACW